MVKTNKEIIEQAQAEIIERGNNPCYSEEQHLKDIALVAALTALKMKYQ